MDQSASLVMVLSVSFREQDAGELLMYFTIGQICRPFFGHNDNVTRGQGSFVTAKKFPHQALYPVASDRLAQALGNHQSQAGVRAFAGSQADAEMRCVHLFSTGLSRKKITPPANPIRLAETGIPFSGRRGAEGFILAGLTGGVAQRGSLVSLPRQTFAIFGPAAL
jgi:hypothetical protein